MLDIKNLSITGRGRVRLLKDVSLSLKPGQCIGLTGASGAGKTTLLKAVMGIMDSSCTITGGSISLAGQALSDMKPKEHRALCGTTIGFIPQNPMTAFERNIRIGRQMEETFRVRLNCSRAAAGQLAEQVLEQVNLSDIKRICRFYPAQLSGGMLQRITVALLLGLKPAYILADEATSALDDKNRNLLLTLLKDYQDQAGILFLSHDPKAMRMLCGRIAVMEKGRIIEEGETNMIYANPQADWTRKFIAAEQYQTGGDWVWRESQ